MKKALITGIAGQDGSYLAELLLEKGYEVYGILHGAILAPPQDGLWRIRHILGRLKLHAGSMDDPKELMRLVEEVRPNECYHLAARSFVSYVFDSEYDVLNTNINSTLHMLSTLRHAAPECRFYFAGSSEMFGLAEISPLDEKTPFMPRSPYGISKVAGFHLTRNYREVNHLYACSGILFNHESPRRGEEFVTRKVTLAAARIKAGQQKKLVLGNLAAYRDWGFAGDYVKAMWLMLQQDKADDFVIATHKTHSVKELVSLAFSCVGLKWEDHVEVDPAFYRPGGGQTLVGNYSKAARALGWSPEVSFEQLVEMMVKADVDLVARSK